MPTDIAELGIVAFALMVVWKLLDVGKQVFLTKRIINGNVKVPVMSPLACQVDPQHFGRIKEIHKYTENVSERIARGQFSCEWKDRDEVRDFAQSIKDLTNEIKGLRLDLKKG